MQSWGQVWHSDTTSAVLGVELLRPCLNARPDPSCFGYSSSNTPIDSTCEVCGNMLTTPAFFIT